MSLGTYTLIKDEACWIAAHILRIIPFVDEMVFFDGNSKDGTIEIIEAIRDSNENGHKIRLFKNKDPKNLQDDYVKVFNECLRSVQSDLAWFLHPDMWVVNPEQILPVKDSQALALSTSIRSFGGDPGGQLYEIKGRGESWKNIYRVRNPDLGAHYHGYYGAWNEDVYFSAITGDQHVLHEDHSAYPYSIEKSGIELLHFSDVRTYSRRLDRMKKCLANQGNTSVVAENHPRVTLKDGMGLSFKPTEWPIEIIEARKKYFHLERGMAESRLLGAIEYLKGVNLVKA